MLKISKLYNDTLSQFVATPEIADSFSSGLKSKIQKLGAATFVGFLALGSAGMAHADSNTTNALMGLSAVGGIVVDGSRPSGLPVECTSNQVSNGVSGWKTGGAALIAAKALSYVGGGNGRVAAQVVGAGAAGALVYNSENERINNDCARYMATGQVNNQNNQNNGGTYQYQDNNPNNSYQYGGRSPQQNNYQNNNGYQNNQNGYSDTPRYNQLPTPTEPIFYQAVDSQGRSFFVTYSNSPGLQALTGNRQGGNDIGSNPTIKRAVEGNLNTLNNDYKRLEQASKNYLNLVNGKNSVEDRYDMNNITGNSNNQFQRNNSNYHQKIQQSLREFDSAYNQYSKDRGITLLVLDNAAGVDNKDLSQYQEAAQLFVAPQSAKVTYSNAYQKELPNRYPQGLKK